MTVWAPVHQFEIACGSAGAFVDVTALGHVLTDQGGVVRSYGRKSSFVDFSGGTFGFTLDNRDGRYTPDATVAGATPLSEGMVVSWQVTDPVTSITRLVSGKIAVGSGIQLVIPDGGGSDSSRVRVTCEDVLIEASRHKPVRPLASAAVMGSKPYLYWPLNDPAGSVGAAEISGAGAPALAASGNVTFGAAGPVALGETQITLAVGAGGTVAPAISTYAGTGVPFTAALIANPAYAAGSRGFLSTWITSSSATVFASAIYWSTTSGNANSINLGPASAILTVNGVNVSTNAFALNIVGVPTLYSAGVTYTLTGSIYTYTLTLYVNGVAASSNTLTSTTLIPTGVTGVSAYDNGALATTSIAHISHGPSLVHEELAGVTTEANRLKLIAASTSEIAIGTIPTDLSTQPIGIANTTSQSVLDMLNDVIRTEQGQLFSNTTGTPSAPIQTIGIRARNRPATPTTATTWAMGTDVLGTPPFLRDLSNTVSEVDATGPSTTAIATDATLTKKVGSANTNFAVLSNNYYDVYTAATDRLNRGRKTGLDVPSFTVPGISLISNRGVDLLAVALGDREEVTGIPSPPLTSTTYDGYLIGVDEYWDSVTANFTLYLEAAGKRTAIFDTDRFMANGALSLNAAITSTTATTMTVATNVPAVGRTPATLLALTGTGTPYNLIIDNEIVTVTACTAPSAGVQTATITRGAAGTTAAAHASGALLEIATQALFAY